MALHDICAYKDQSTKGAKTDCLADHGTITGHHIIPDHCFYYTSGLRGKGDLTSFLAPGTSNYKTENAPVILVTADLNGGKSREHGDIHKIFDPIEKKAAEEHFNEWTYLAARTAAIQSICGVLSKYTTAQLKKKLDEYFIDVCGISLTTKIRAGEHGAMKSRPSPRRSQRYSPY